MVSPGLDIAYCWDFPDSPVDGLRRLKSFGFEGIELWPAWIDHFSGIEIWRDALTETGMRCFQLCPYFDFVHGTPELEASRAEFNRFMRYAAVVDCKRLRVFTGPVPAGQAVGAMAASPKQWEQAIEMLRLFCSLAEPASVELCLECHEGMLMEDSPGALKLIRSVDRPNLTVNLQLPLLGEEPVMSVAALGKFTTHMHLHNWDTDSKDFGQGLTYISAGWFDWEPVLTQLVLEQDRHICISVEHANHGGKHSAWTTAERDGPFLQKLRANVVAKRSNWNL